MKNTEISIEMVTLTLSLSNLEAWYSQKLSWSAQYLYLEFCSLTHWAHNATDWLVMGRNKSKGEVKSGVNPPIFFHSLLLPTQVITLASLTGVSDSVPFVLSSLPTWTRGATHPIPEAQPCFRNSMYTKTRVCFSSEIRLLNLQGLFLSQKSQFPFP